MRSLVVVLLVLPAIALAQPAITDISGQPNVVTHGSSIVITGAAFGTKPNPAPLKWETFEAGSNGVPLASVQPEWNVFQPPHTGALYSNIQKHAGNLAGYSTTIGKTYNPAQNNLWETNYITLPQSDTIFMSYWIRVDSPVREAYGVHKLNRISSSTAAGGGGVYNGTGSFTYGGTGPGGWQLLLYSTDVPPDGSSGKVSFPNNDIYNEAPQMGGGWYQVYMGRTLNDIGVNNGWLSAGNLWLDSPAGNPSATGHEEKSLDNMQNVFVAGTHNGKSLQLDTVLLGFEIANTTADEYLPGGQISIYIDDLYIDNTRARVELGNNAVYNNCTHREMQIPSSWSPTEITIAANTGTFPQGAAWLFVINAAGQPSTGFPVSVVSGPAQPAPGVPGQPQLAK